MVVGDIITILHNAGDGNTFSYTAAAGVNILTTNIAGLNWGVLSLNNFVSGTTGVEHWVTFSNNSSGKPLKAIFSGGQTLNHTDNDFDSYGLCIYGVQV